MKVFPLIAAAASPKLTVITPSLNHGRFIGGAVRSAGVQAGVAFEHIVVDAASIDETAAVLAEFPHLQVHVCPGMDSHAALNHALGCARGEVVGFLNADDRYEPGALDAVLAAFAADPSVEMLCGGMRIFADAPEGEAVIARFDHTGPRDMPLELTFGNPGFNSWFFRRGLLDRLGGFQVRYSFGADRDLLLRAYALTRPKALARLVYHYRTHQGSRTMDPRGTNRAAMVADHLAMIAAQRAAGIWRADATMRAMLDRWEALERFKCVVRSTPATVLRAVLQTPWPLVPQALLLRRRWLRILRRGGGAD